MDQEKQIQPMDDQDRHTIIENQTNNNCQQFFGPVSGCVFAMPGSTVNQITEASRCEEPESNDPISELPDPEKKRKSFIKAFVELMENNYMGDIKYFKYDYDHIVVEHVAASLNIIPKYNAHKAYLEFLSDVEQQGYSIVKRPDSEASLSKYIRCIDSSNPDYANWKYDSNSLGAYTEKCYKQMVDFLMRRYNRYYTALI